MLPSGQALTRSAALAALSSLEPCLRSFSRGFPAKLIACTRSTANRSFPQFNGLSPGYNKGLFRIGASQSACQISVKQAGSTWTRAAVSVGPTETAGGAERRGPGDPQDMAPDMATEDGFANLRMFPAIEPYRTGTLAVSPLHTLYFEESGNPQGKPVIFLHGGPGGGTTPSNRRFFDPSFYRIVLMDQRGSGKSTPHANLEENTTWHLVADIETLRAELKIDKWLVFGGSWGSTLSLAYAITHPEAVLGLVLRGIFLLRRSEIEWFYQKGADTLFPDVFEPYASFIPEEERHDLVTAYNKRLMDDTNPDLQSAAARRWTDWEMQTSYLVPNESRIKQGEDDKFALAFARIENHYFFNKGFFSSDNFLLENVPKIRHIPCIIVQGRYDVVCPFRSAWDLHKAWPASQLRVVSSAGHSANEVGITSELVRATEEFKNKL